MKSSYVHKNINIIVLKSAVIAWNLTSKVLLYENISITVLKNAVDIRFYNTTIVQGCGWIAYIWDMNRYE